HRETGFGGGRDQFDDDPVADERLGAPVLADEGEKPVFDFVPLAGAGRQVADHNVEAEFVGQLLKFAFHIWYEKAVVDSIFTLSKVDSIISGRALRAFFRRPAALSQTLLPAAQPT